MLILTRFQCTKSIFFFHTRQPSSLPFLLSLLCCFVCLWNILHSLLTQFFFLSFFKARRANDRLFVFPSYVCLRFLLLWLLRLLSTSLSLSHSLSRKRTLRNGFSPSIKRISKSDMLASFFFAYVRSIKVNEACRKKIKKFRYREFEEGEKKMRFVLSNKKLLTQLHLAFRNYRLSN